MDARMVQSGGFVASDDCSAGLRYWTSIATLIGLSGCSLRWREYARASFPKGPAALPTY
jgi:hypothetical protein